MVWKFWDIHLWQWSCADWRSCFVHGHGDDELHIHDHHNDFDSLRYWSDHHRTASGATPGAGIHGLASDIYHWSKCDTGCCHRPCIRSECQHWCCRVEHDHCKHHHRFRCTPSTWHERGGTCGVCLQSFFSILGSCQRLGTHSRDSGGGEGCDQREFGRQFQRSCRRPGFRASADGSSGSRLPRTARCTLAADPRGVLPCLLHPPCRWPVLCESFPSIEGAGGGPGSGWRTSCRWHRPRGSKCCLVVGCGWWFPKGSKGIQRWLTLGWWIVFTARPAYKYIYNVLLGLA